MNYTIHYENNPQLDDIYVLYNGIMSHARDAKNIAPLELFGFFIRDSSGKILGGCSGENLNGCVYVHALWMDESLRGQRYGTQLMQAAEKLARERGSNLLTVNTFDWQALEFYKKLGFYVEFERSGYHNNSTYYFLRKDLV